MFRLLKWVAGAATVFALLLVGVAMALQHWLRTDDFRARAEREASAAAGLPVKLGRLTVDLWPLPAVAAEQVRLQTRPALTLDRIEARPEWLPLLAGELRIATLVVRKAVLPQAAIAAIGAAMEKKERAQPRKAAVTEKAPMVLPRKVVLDDITWVDEKGQRMTMDARVDFGGDGLLDDASFKIVRGRLAGTEGRMERAEDHWPVKVTIGGGRIAGRLQLHPGKAGGQLLTGQLTTENVEVSAITAPSRMLTGKLQANTTLRSEYKDIGQLADVLQTQTRFTVKDAVIQGIDLAKAVETIGLSRGGITNLDTLAGQVATRGKQVDLTNLVATSGNLAAHGNVSIAPSKALGGRIVVDLTSARGAVNVPLVVGGTLDDPSVNLTRGALVGAAVGTLIAPGIGTGAGATAGDRIGESLRGLFGK